MNSTSYTEFTTEQKVFTVLGLIAFMVAFTAVVLPIFVPELSQMESAADADFYKQSFVAMGFSVGSLFVAFKM